MDGGDHGGHEGEYLVRGPPPTHTHSPHFELDVERKRKEEGDLRWRNLSRVEEEGDEESDEGEQGWKMGE